MSTVLWSFRGGDTFPDFPQGNLSIPRFQSTSARKSPRLWGLGQSFFSSDAATFPSSPITHRSIPCRLLLQPHALMTRVVFLPPEILPQHLFPAVLFLPILFSAEESFDQWFGSQRPSPPTDDTTFIDIYNPSAFVHCRPCAGSSQPRVSLWPTTSFPVNKPLSLPTPVLSWVHVGFNIHPPATPEEALGSRTRRGSQYVWYASGFTRTPSSWQDGSGPLLVSWSLWEMSVPPRFRTLFPFFNSDSPPFYRGEQPPSR